MDPNQNIAPQAVEPTTLLSIPDIRERHKIIARLDIQGLSNIEIAEIVGLTVVRVSQIKQQPLYKALVQSLSSQLDQETLDIRKKLALIAPKALGRIEQLIDSNDQKVALAASKDVLDRAGFKPIEVSARVDANEIMDADKIREAKRRIENAIANGLIIDVEATPSQGELQCPE